MTRIRSVSDVNIFTRVVAIVRLRVLDCEYLHSMTMGCKNVMNDLNYAAPRVIVLNLLTFCHFLFAARADQFEKSTALTHTTVCSTSSFTSSIT